MASRCKTEAQRKARRRAAQAVPSFWSLSIEPPPPRPLRDTGSLMKPLTAKVELPGVYGYEYRDGVLYLIRIDD